MRRKLHLPLTRQFDPLESAKVMMSPFDDLPHVTALRAVTALGLIADLVDATAGQAAIDLDRLLGDDS
jgi:hypothetical protein